MIGTSMALLAMLSSTLVAAQQKVWITMEGPDDGRPDDKGTWRDVYNYNNCIEEFPDQQGLITSKYAYPDPDRVEGICLHMSTGMYCDEETYSMDFTLDGRFYKIATVEDKAWQSYRFGKGPCGNQDSDFHLDTSTVVE